MSEANANITAMSCSTISFMCETSGIRVRGLPPNLAALVCARVSIAHVENATILLSGIGTLGAARDIYLYLSKRQDLQIVLSDDLRVAEAVKHADDFVKGELSEADFLPWVKILIRAMKFRWIDIDTKFQIGKVLARLHAQQERGLGLGGYRILMTARYNAMIDGLRAKDEQIVRLLREITSLEARLIKQAQLRNVVVPNC